MSTHFTPAEEDLVRLLIERAGWLQGWDDAVEKYDSLSSGERYIVDVVRNPGQYPIDPRSMVDDGYAELVKAVIEERGQT